VKEAIDGIRSGLEVMWENIVVLNVFGIGDVTRFVHGLMARLGRNQKG